MSATLQRKLGLWASISIVIGTVIGSSIFMKPSTMASQLGSPYLLILVWVIAGIVSIFGGMINAEIGSAIPETGGQYIYFKKMYGDFFAYLYGWAGFVVINTAAIAGIAFVFAQYTGYFIEIPHLNASVEQSFVINLPFIGKLFPLQYLGIKILAILLIVILTVINSINVKAAGSLHVLLTMIKITALVVVILMILFSGRGSFGNFINNSSGFDGSFMAILTGFIAATTGALAAYDGWNNLGFVAGEIKNPTRNIPRGLIIGISCCMILYVLTTLAYLYALPIDDMRKSTRVATDALTLSIGSFGGGLVAALVIISTAGGANGNILPCARINLAMSHEKRFFPFAGKITRNHTPANALWLQAGWASFLVLIGSFDMLMDMFVFVTWVFYGFAAYGIFIFRKKMPVEKSTYRVKAYPIIPVIFLLFAALYVSITLYTDITNFVNGKTKVINSVLGLVLTASGIPLYFYFRRKSSVSN